MDRKEYEEMIKRPDVIDEAVIKGTLELLQSSSHKLSKRMQRIMDENQIKFRPDEIGKTGYKHYRIDLNQSEVKSVLSVISKAHSKHGDTAPAGDVRLTWLEHVWEKCLTFISR